MTKATVDDLKRIRLPDAQPGQVLAIEANPEGGWKLTPLAPISGGKKWTKTEVLEAIEQSPMRFTKSWDEIKKETR